MIMGNHIDGNGSKPPISEIVNFPETQKLILNLVMYFWYAAIYISIQHWVANIVYTFKIYKNWHRFYKISICQLHYYTVLCIASLGFFP